MSLYRPSSLLSFLEENRLRPKKALSQNFLIDQNILNKMIAAAEVSAEDLVIEIGPGPGVLTEALLATGAKVLAVEMDRKFAAALLRLQTVDQQLEVIEEDFLQFPLEDYLKKSPRRIKVVANVPYHITTPILAKLAPLHHFISTVTLMVQKEYAQRMVSQKETPEYSSLSLFLNFYAMVRYCFTVPATCFLPRPKVQSAVVQLLLKQPPPIDPVPFFKMTRSAFQQRRKMVRSSLKELYPPEKIALALKTVQIREDARPEQLSLEEFMQFFASLIS